MLMRSTFLQNLRFAIIELGIAVILLILLTSIFLLPRTINNLPSCIGVTIPKNVSDKTGSVDLTVTKHEAYIYSDDEERLAAISRIVQTEIEKLQNNSALCSGPTFLCGHQFYCGLACQIHHRMTCVALSYALQIPLIHDDKSGWPYNKPWSSVFVGPGSSCKPNSETIIVQWALGYDGLPLLQRNSTKELKWGNYITSSQVLPFPLQNGFVVPRGVGEVVEKLHENPFLWWAGQFAKFTMRLTMEQGKIVEEAKQRISVDKWNHPIVGIHVRKTDKVYEDSGSIHQIEEYITASESILDLYFNQSVKKPTLRTIFLASDDNTVLLKAKRSYPDLSIIGFAAPQTFRTQLQRANSLDDIINDLTILSKSDLMVCGFSSNICRLLLELLATRFLDAEKRVKAMDRAYIYQLHGIGNIPNKVNFM